jgi:hypothetical protein
MNLSILPLYIKYKPEKANRILKMSRLYGNDNVENSHVMNLSIQSTGKNPLFIRWGYFTYIFSLGVI